MNNRALTAITVLGGLLSATLSLLHLTPFSGLFFVSYFSCLPLFLIGLGIGLRPLYGAGLIATFVVFLFDTPVLGAEFFIFSVLGPSFLINRALLKRKKASGEVLWYPSSFLLRDLTLASFVVMLLTLGAYFYLTQGGDVHELAKTVLKTFDPEGRIRDAESLLIKIFSLLPGFFAFSWTVMMLINAAIAQGLLIRFNRNLRPSPSFENLEAPKSFLIALGISFIISMIGIGYVELLGKNAVFVFVFPFFVIGLGVIHRLLHKTSFPMVGLTIFYFILFLLLWPALFVILLGILKPWIEKSISPN